MTKFWEAFGLKLWDTHYMGSTVINTEGTSNMIEFLRIWSIEREREGVVDELQKWWVIPLSASTPFAMYLYCSSHQEVKVCPDLCIEAVVCLDWINRIWQKWHCARPGLHQPMHIYVLFLDPQCHYEDRFNLDCWRRKDHMKHSWVPVEAVVGQQPLNRPTTIWAHEGTQLRVKRTTSQLTLAQITDCKNHEANKWLWF